MGFRESLPTNCPPKEAQDGECAKAFRLVPTASPCADDFASHKAKDVLMPPTIDPCRWSSCSLYPDLETVNKKRRTFPKLRAYAFVAELKIKAGSGLLVQETKHIDFWMYDTFDPLSAIVDVKGLEDG